MRVLVTDAGYKHSLAAIRSLASHGVEVFAAAPERSAQGLYSRVVSERLRLPPASKSEEFIDAVIAAVRTHAIDVVLPIGYWSCVACSKHLARLSEVTHAAVPSWSSMQIASDKARTLELAARIGLSIPKTYAAREEVDRFPVVVKGTLDSGQVRYVNSAAELATTPLEGALIQDYIVGSGFGLLALFEHGVERAVFMHRRIREYPVTGGASTAAESFHDPELRELGLHLLRALDWHGVAMVEFKRSTVDGRYWLMEINPKFWGSLELSIRAGVDFPWLTVQLAAGLPFDAMPDYPEGVRFQWVSGDLMHVFAQPTDSPAIVRDLLDRSVLKDLHRSDWVPGAISLFQTSRGVLRRAVRGELRRPHGDARLR